MDPLALTIGLIIGIPASTTCPMRFSVLFYWVQGNMTGVNISLFNEYNDYVNLSRVEEPEITDLVACGSGVTLPPSAAAISRSIDLIPAPPVRRNSPVLRNERAGNARRLR